MNKYIASRLDNVECIIKRTINKLEQLKKSRIQDGEVKFTLDNLSGAIEMISQIRSRMNGSDRDML